MEQGVRVDTAAELRLLPAGPGRGLGQARSRLFTDAGPQHLRLAVEDSEGSYGALQGGGPIGGSSGDLRMSGRFVILPPAGDCVTVPITRVRLICEERIINAVPGRSPDAH